MREDLPLRLRIGIHTSEDESVLRNEAADEIERLRDHIAKQEMDIMTLGQEVGRLKEKCDRQAMILRRLTPENFPDIYFICGEAGEKDGNGLPEKILVVPAYGVDWHMTYQRTDKVFGLEW
jgi:hypothetical protein